MISTNAVPPPHLGVSRLTVRRGERLLFENLNFAVAGGEVLLLRGANGAGKTTLLLALAGIVRPDAGTIAYSGQDPERAVHLLTYQHGLKSRLTVRENLAFWRALNGTSGLAVEAVLERVGIAAIAALETGYLSSGQLRRLSLARLLVTERPIWLLDEPTAALDGAGEALVGALIDVHRDAGGITIVATHHDLAVSSTANVRTLYLGGQQ